MFPTRRGVLLNQSGRKVMILGKDSGAFQTESRARFLSFPKSGFLVCKPV